MINIKRHSIDFILLLITVLLLINSTDPVIQGDSRRYLGYNLSDPPIVPWFVKITLYLFGSLKAVVILQTLAIYFGVVKFTKTISKYFDIKILTKLFIALFLFIPIINFYRHILSESLSYAFYLFFASYIIKLIFNFKIKNVVCITLFAVALLNLRSQFIFIYVIIFIIYLSIFIINKKNTFSFLLISFISIFLIHNTLTKVNDYILQNFFKEKVMNKTQEKNGPFNYIFIDAIYISSIEDAELLEDDKIKNTTIQIFKKMHNENSLQEYYNGRGHFGLSFAIIRDYSNLTLNELALNKNVSIYDLKKKISLTLLSKNFFKYLKFIFKKFYDSTWLFVIVPAILLIPALINFIKYRNQFSLVVVFFSSFALANHSIVYLFGRVQPRYLIYSDFALLVIIFLVFIHAFKKSINKS
jgi:hypothetical protein